MKISQEGINLIKKYEGCRLQAYSDSVGVITIGYGHTATAKKGMIISQTKAEELLKSDLKRFEEGVTRLVGLKIHQLMFDSLVSFAFNLGLGNLQKSTLLKKINLGKFEDVENEFIKWNRAGGKVLEGLTRRRNAEKELFLKGFKDLQINEIIKEGN